MKKIQNITAGFIAVFIILSMTACAKSGPVSDGSDSVMKPTREYFENIDKDRINMIYIIGDDNSERIYKRAY